MPAGDVGRRIAAWVIGAAALDGLTKLVASHLAEGSIGGPITDVRNAGLSMSAVPNGSPLLVWAALAMVVLFGGWTAALARRGSIPAWMPGLLIGGAGANLADRAVFGAVHDWLALGPVVLNLADVMILVAAVGVLATGSPLPPPIRKEAARRAASSPLTPRARRSAPAGRPRQSGS
jgi:lipoprotein signal peptidase